MIFGLSIPHTESEPTVVPLVRRSIDLVVRQDGVHGKESLFFMNQTNESINTEFKFPSKRCRVHNLRFKTDDGNWKCMIVEEKLKAQATYDHAVSSGNQAVIAKQSTTDVFSIEIGRLQPYQMVTVELNYIAELDWIGSYTYRHQLTGFPHYIPTETFDEKCQEKMLKLTSNKLPYGVFLSVTFEDTQHFTAEVITDQIFKDLKSDESFRVNVPRTLLSGNKDITVKMTPTQSIPSVFSTETDTHMYFQVCCGHTPADLGVAKMIADKTQVDAQLKQMLDEYETGDDLQLNAHPVDKHYTFVVDGSGSMSGTRIENAKKALKLAVKQLPEGSKYAILVFGDNNYNKNNYYPESTRINEEVKKDTQPIHYGIYCDHCRQGPIQGERWNMTNKDFDLCGRCYNLEISSRPEMSSKYTHISCPEQKTTAELAGKSESDVVKSDFNEWIVHNDDTYPVTDAHIDSVVSANYGGTRMEYAIRSVYNRLYKKDNNVIVLLTDAGIGSDEVAQIHTLSKEHEVQAEIYCIGIGTGHQSEFLDGLAKIGRGVSKHITTGPEIKETVQRLMRCAVNSQFLRNLKLDVPSYVEVSTANPIDIYFYGEPMTFYLKLQKDKMTDDTFVTLKSDTYELLNLPLASHRPSPFNLEQVYHMVKLEQMIKYPDVYRSYSTEVVDGKMSKEEYTKTIVELGCKYGVVTEYTSAVVVEELVNSEDGSIQLKKVDVPLGMASDFMPPPVYAQSRGMSASLMAMSCGPSLYSVAKKKSSNGRHSIPKPQYESCSYQEEEEDDDMGFDVFSLGDCSGSTQDCAPNTFFASESKEKTTKTKTTEEMIEFLVNCQKISDGSWAYDENLLKQLIKTDLEKYTNVVGSVDNNVLMTMMIMAYFNYNPEFYTTYSTSETNAYKFLNSKMKNASDLVSQLTLVGF